MSAAELMTSAGHVFVSGAGSGIGRAVALRFAASGREVVCSDLDLSAAAATSTQGGPHCSALEMDVREEKSVRLGFEEARAEMGSRLEVLVNVAGIGSTVPVPETSTALWDEVEAVNSRGTFLCCREAIPRLIAGGGGVIVNIASVAGLVGLRNRAAYCASKGAVVALTRAMALDHIADDVRVNCVCPGTVDSPWVRRLVSESGESMSDLVSRQPLGRLGTPEEVAAAVDYLASAEAGFATGTILTIDGGLTAG